MPSTCMFTFSNTPGPFSRSFPKTQSGPRSSRVRDFSRVLSSEIMPVPDHCRGALAGLWVSGHGECRMLPVTTASTGPSAGQETELCHIQGKEEKHFCKEPSSYIQTSKK